VTATAGEVRARVEAALAARRAAGDEYFSAQAERLARLCHLVAERFAAGGRILALGASPAAASDARHLAVEFVHPVIVGKRALPALALAGAASGARALALARPQDIVVAFGEGEAAATVAELAARGCLTLAFAPTGAQWEFAPACADASIRQELVETLYHLLWELVHVFFEHRGLLRGAGPRATGDAGRASFLYPFLTEAQDALEPVLEDVRRSVLMKAAEVAALREQTLRENAPVLAAAAGTLRAAFADGGTVWALGNGGSATDAADLVADLAADGHPAGELAEDPAVLTAIANDVGMPAIFTRQLIALARPGDVLVALSSSGGSANVLAALAHARAHRIATIAFAGYDGGEILRDALADHLVVTRSQHVPRIQEAQAGAYHVLVELARS